MIITILPTSGNFHAVAYNEKKVEQGLAELIEVSNFSALRQQDYSADTFTKYLEDYSSRNDRIKNAQFHVSISCKGDEYTHQQLLDIAHMYLKEMGYAEDGQPLLVYAHHDTPNNHIHIITSRIAPDGHKISDKFERKRGMEATKKVMEQYSGKKQEPTVNEVAQAALGYRFTSKAQFCAILESQGYECKEDEQKPIIYIYKGGDALGYIQVQTIMQHALRDNQADEKRRRQLRAILLKYRNLSANKEELAATMKKKFGVSLVFVGKKDSPYGYFLVDHKNKSVYKGSDFLSVKELLQFEDAKTRFAKISQTIDTLLTDNPNLTTKDINRVLYRQFGTRVHKGTISWNDQTISLSPEVQEQLRHNNRVAMGLPDNKITIAPPAQAPKEQPHAHRPPSNYQPLRQTNNAGSSYANREHEVGNGNGMDLSVDNEERQRSRWKR